MRLCEASPGDRFGAGGDAGKGLITFCNEKAQRRWMSTGKAMVRAPDLSPTVAVGGRLGVDWSEAVDSL